MTQPDHTFPATDRRNSSRMNRAGLFDQIAVTQSARVVEIGCGPHGCLDLIPVTRQNSASKAKASQVVRWWM